MSGRARALPTAIALAALLGGAAFEARAQSAEDLDDLRQRIGASRERVEEHEVRERALFDRLEQIDRRLAGLEAKVRAATTDARRARAALTEIERETERLARQLEATRAAMARRAIALYKTGQVGPVRALFSSNSLREVLERSSTLRFLIEYDASLAERFQRDYLAYEAARGDAEKATRRNEAAADRLGREQAALERERRSKSDVLLVARRDRALERAILVELEKAAHALETTLAELGRAERKHGEWVDGSGFGARRGALPLPVRARIAARFGKVVDAEFLTATFRTGIEFAAPAGKRVRAVSKGEVRFAGWFRGYGKIVILDHGDEYFTISGHLSEIDVEVGDRVREGSAIGRVGDTGSLAGPLLYFELRRGGEPIDPTGWFAPDRLAEAG